MLTNFLRAMNSSGTKQVKNETWEAFRFQVYSDAEIASSRFGFFGGNEDETHQRE